MPRQSSAFMHWRQGCRRKGAFGSGCRNRFRNSFHRCCQIGCWRGFGCGCRRCRSRGCKGECETEWCLRYRQDKEGEDWEYSQKVRYGCGEYRPQKLEKDENTSASPRQGTGLSDPFRDIEGRRRLVSSTLFKDGSSPMGQSDPGGGMGVVLRKNRNSK